MTLEPKVDFIFEALLKAEVTFTDFSAITRVSRPTLYRWRDKMPIADRLRLDLAYTTALRLKKACQLGKLPLMNRLKKEKRQETLRKIISEMATK